jgi:hypothetical protein
LTYANGGNLALWASAGYPGTAIFGSLLIWWGRNPGQARIVLHSIGIVMLALTAFWAEINWFSFVTMLLISIALIVISSKANEKICHLLLMFMGAMTALGSLACIRTILIASIFGLTLTVPNDADIVAKQIGIPAVLIELTWALIALGALIFSFWISYRPHKQAVAPSAAKGTPPETGTPPDNSADETPEKKPVVVASATEDEASSDGSTQTSDIAAAERGL